MAIYVPPGGFAAWSQMTPASKAGQAGGKMRSAKRGRTRKKRGGAKGRKTTKTRARRSSARKLKFGSPAWRKKYMRKK